MHFVCYFSLSIRIYGLGTKKTSQDANTFNFPTTIKLLTESFSQNII